MSDLDKSLRGLGNKDVGSTSRTQSEKPTRAPENKDKFKKLVERRTERAPDEEDQEELTMADSNSVFDLAAKKAGQEQQMQATPPPLSPTSRFAPTATRSWACAMERPPERATCCRSR